MKTIPIIPSPAPEWRLGWLLQAPHRLAFAAAACVLPLSAVWWAVVLVAPHAGLTVRWSLPPSLAHGVLMSFGFMPLFFAGFLFTAGTKWLRLPAVPAPALLPHVVPMVCGWVVFALAAHGPDAAFGRSLGAIGVAAVAFGWFGIVRRFAALVAASRETDRVHARLIAAACMQGVVALGLVCAGLASGDAVLVRAVTRASLWAFIGMVFVVVLHRMIPFFSAAAVPALDAWRPLWLLWCFVALTVFEAAVEFVTTCAGGMPHANGVLAFAAAVEAVAGVGLVALAIRWSVVQNLRVRLLAMLHAGFAWLGVAVLLAAASHAMAAASGGTASLGLAPLHAYTVGFLGSTMFAMVTRVSCGLAGRAVVADDFIWRLFGVLQLVVMARVAAALPSGLGMQAIVALLAIAAIGWATVCACWAVRYGRWFGTPRLDRRPG